VGCFDTVNFQCPDPVCDCELFIQSKTGACTLSDYSNRAIPLDVAKGVHGKTVYCKDCKKSYVAVVRAVATLVPIEDE
jgi:hypothetical protein